MNRINRGDITKNIHLKVKILVHIFRFNNVRYKIMQ